MNINSHFYIGSYFFVPKHKITKYQHNKIQKDLIAKPKASNSLYTQDPYKIYSENKKYFGIPRYYGLTHFGLPKKIIVGHVPMNPNIRFIGKLYTSKYNNQQYIANICIQKMTKYCIGQGILVIPTGCGKTITALYIACKLKLKTFIIVNSDILFQQWINRIQQFVKNAKIGVIRSKDCQIKSYDIVIGMVQSFLRNKYDNLKLFGMVILDECHRAPAKSYINVIYKLQPKYLLGLSATPYRPDGLFNVLEWMIGPILYKQTTRPPEKVMVFINKISYKHFNIKYINKFTKIPNKSKMENNIFKNMKRNCIICNNIFNIFIKSKVCRKFLIFTSRVDHIQILKDILKPKIMQYMKDIYRILSNIFQECHIKDNILSFILPTNLTLWFGELHGRIKKKDRPKQEYKQFLFVTYHIAKEGLDLKGFNTGIFTMPIGNITQVMGRILKRGNDPKQCPIIMDLVDNISLFWRLGKKRINVYKQHKFIIKNDSYSI
jgi:hypothetical protein